MAPLSEMGRFATVVIDPPWSMPPSGLTKAIRGRSVPNTVPLPYPSIEPSEIADIPVRSVLADDAFLFLWTVNKFIPEGFALLEQWGLSYSFTMTWMKSKGMQYPGSPYFNTEWVLVGRKGEAEI